MNIAPEKNKLIVLGVDPGLSCAGFAIIQKNGSSPLLIQEGYFSTKPSLSIHERIGLFYDHFDHLVKQYSVNILALETPFLGKNAQNFLKLGYLRGVLYLIARQHLLMVHEFSPCEVKKQITGFGGAQKDQVARVLIRFIPSLSNSLKHDVTDAIAISLCGMWQGHNQRYNP